MEKIEHLHKKINGSRIVNEMHDEYYEELILQQDYGQLLQENKNSTGFQIRNAAYQGMVVAEDKGIQINEFKYIQIINAMHG